MTIFRLLTIAAVCLTLIAGCRPKPVHPVSVITVPFEQADVIDMEQFIESVRFVQLQNHRESAFTDIDKLIVNGSDMFMLDKRLKAVFCFDTTGRFRYRIQRVGRGPGEYQDLESMWINPVEKELWLESFFPSKFMVYDFDGRMLREIRCDWPANDVTRLGKNLLVAYNPAISIREKDSLLPGMFLLGEDGTNRGQIKTFGDSALYWSVSYQRHLEEFGGGALLLSQSDTIFRITETGDVLPDVALDWGKLRQPDEMRRIYYNTPRTKEALKGNYVHAKDQLIAFGPIRLFRVFIENHMELALADLSTKKGIFSTQMSCKLAKVPLIYPLEKTDQGNLIGLYDMPLLLAIKETQPERKDNPGVNELYHVMDSLVESALAQDRPVLWIAKIKNEWLTKTY